MLAALLFATSIVGALSQDVGALTPEEIALIQANRDSGRRRQVGPSIRTTDGNVIVQAVSDGNFSYQIGGGPAVHINRLPAQLQQYSDTNLAAFALGWELARDGGTAAALSDLRIELGDRVIELRAGLAAAVTTLEWDENRTAMAAAITAQVAAAAADAGRGRTAVNRSLTRALASVRDEVDDLDDRIAVNEANITALANRSSVTVYDDIPWDRYSREAQTMAMGACVGMSGRATAHFVVQRQCGGQYPSCAAACSRAGAGRCFNSLHIYTRPGTRAPYRKSLQMHRYNSCGGGCGPNFCCCRH